MIITRYSDVVSVKLCNVTDLVTVTYVKFWISQSATIRSYVTIRLFPTIRPHFGP